uniref:RNA helicase n=1 Tax=Periophthalmus magnuspinnatus TaxID=409849 RepID=A0A3B3ZR53_9GOBI
MAASVRRAAHDIETRKRTDDVVLSENINFSSLLLSEPVLQGLSAAGFEKPSPIQLKAIPLGRCGLDLIVQAKSGTGKTCVFCTIALDSLILENPATQVLVLAPTREIAVQIHSVVMAIGCAMEGLECHLFIGGRPVSQDKAHLKKCHIAVGSPGRIKQLIELGMLSTASIRLFVLDEADKLLEEGSFQEQINWIFSSLPVTKQMLALSATYPESLAQHLTRYMIEPTFVRLNPSDMGLKGLKQYYKLVQGHPLPHKVFEEKVQHLLELFSKIPFNQSLVFSNLHTRAQHLADILSSKGLPSVCISGGLSQDQRLEAMSKLKQYQCRVLISTDLTARGIDAEKVNLVINLDVPQDWETYMHRIGRAGRFGTQGLAVTYCCHGEEENKMMAIAQKCGLSLFALPSSLEPSLMEEACDWDVCTKASNVDGPMFPVVSKSEKKHRTKDVVMQKESSIKRRDIDDRPKHKLNDEEDLDSHPQTRVMSQKPSNHRPIVSHESSRKEKQEALPKIPPLSSFKTYNSRFVTFEEAEWDFQNFITKGLGRTVEVIRQYGGRDEGSSEDLNGHTESFILDDNSAKSVVVTRENRRQLISPSVSPRSQSDMEENEIAENLNQNEGNSVKTAVMAPNKNINKPTSVKPKKGLQIDSVSSDSSYLKKDRVKTGVKLSKRTGKTAAEDSDQTSCRKIKKEKPKQNSWGRNNTRRNREAEHEEEEDEEEYSTDRYWSMWHSSWDQYHPYQQYAYHSYYSAAQWMAAYRMNAVYIEELLKY